MRFMMLMIPKGYEQASPGAMPSAEHIAEMMKYNEQEDCGADWQSARDGQSRSAVEAIRREPLLAAMLRSGAARQAGADWQSAHTAIEKQNIIAEGVPHAK